jgi:glycosyltransferase involved in cell wall biosynthesis
VFSGVEASLFATLRLMKIVIVGPAHPYKGGIAQHTTVLANRLADAGHEVELISWKTQYPFFYPGEQFVQNDKPEVPPFAYTKRLLSWKRPDGWLRWGRQLRRFDRVILVWWVPTIQGPVYATMLRAMGKRGPAVTVICHNVLPHEGRPGDKRLTREVFGRASKLIVHSPAQAKLAASITRTTVRELTLPMTVVPLPRKLPPKTRLDRQLLFFGFIRPYKGLDVLFKALAKTPDIKLIVAGEFWSNEQEYLDMIQELDLTQRVRIISGYVPSDELATLIAKSDAVVLPYREGTGSWNVSMAHAYGTPVIATSAGTLASQVRDGVDGLVCKPDDVDDLHKVIKAFYADDLGLQLRRQVSPVSSEHDWQNYTQGVIES